VYFIPYTFNYSIILTDYEAHWQHNNNNEPGKHSRYTDWLRAGRTRDLSSSPGRIKKFLFFTSSGPVLGPTQPPILWAQEALSPWVKRPGREANHSPPTSAELKKT
jgi:hypothetical protein